MSDQRDAIVEHYMAARPKPPDDGKTELERVERQLLAIAAGQGGRLKYLERTLRDQTKLIQKLRKELKQHQADRDLHLPQPEPDYYWPDATPLDELPLPVRVYNCCHNENLKTAGEIRERRPVELLRIPNFGLKSLRDLRAIVDRPAEGKHYVIGSLCQD